MSLRANFRNWLWEGSKKYRINTDSSGNSTITDITQYTQQGDTIGAEEINQICNAINSNADLIEELQGLEPEHTNNSIRIGDVLVQWGNVNITPSSGSSSKYYGTANISFPTEYRRTPAVMVCGGSGYTDLQNVSRYNVAKAGFSAFLVSSGQTARNLAWLSIGQV